MYVCLCNVYVFFICWLSITPDRTDTRHNENNPHALSTIKTIICLSAVNRGTEDLTHTTKA